MEILLGLVVSGITEIAKVISAKLGKELTSKLIYGIVFLGTFVFTYMLRAGVISMADVQNFIEIFSTAVASYEIVIKRVLKPALDLE